MPATAPLRHLKECRRRKCNTGEIPHATLRNSICIFEEKVLAKNSLYPNLTVRESLEYVGIMSGVQFMKSLQSKMFILWTERSATLPERW